MTDLTGPISLCWTLYEKVSETLDRIKANTEHRQQLEENLGKVHNRLQQWREAVATNWQFEPKELCGLNKLQAELKDAEPQLVHIAGELMFHKVSCMRKLAWHLSQHVYKLHR